MTEILFDKDLTLVEFLNICKLFMTRNPSSADMPIKAVLSEIYTTDIKRLELSARNNKPIVELHISK